MTQGGAVIGAVAVAAVIADEDLVCPGVAVDPQDQEFFTVGVVLRCIGAERWGPCRWVPRRGQRRRVARRLR